MSNKNTLSCSHCSAVLKKKGKTHCWSGDSNTKPPNYCPSGERQIIEESFARYQGDSPDAKMAKVAAQVEGLCYQPIPGSDAVNARWTRVEDTIAFAKLMGYHTIGIATCLGLLAETEQLVEILKAQGFNPLSICCKAGSIDKMKLDLEEKNKVQPGMFEPACNPIAQAEFLNAAGSDMNIIVGLCIGHDILFTKYSKAPVTTLVVKDRVTGHNPVSVLYGQNVYYRRLKTQKLVIEGFTE